MNNSLPDIDTLKAEILDLFNQSELSEQNGSSNSILQALASIVEIGKLETDRLDWKLVVGSLQDMRRAIEVFHPYRHVRKISIFGSSRTQPHEPEYIQARQFAEAITTRGFMVLTGAGNGIMAAGNQGAGCDRSFGLNIELPFEQDSNIHIQACDRLIEFKYFFTRKLFFVKESDAIVLFPGGFGTLDEFFECLVLAQTGRSNPTPIVLIDHPDGNFWQNWDIQIQKYLLDRNLVSQFDRSLYRITDQIEVACQIISDFYKVYHSCRRVEDLLVIRLNSEITDSHLDKLNYQFADILVKGEITRSPVLEVEKQDIEIRSFPRLLLYFDFSSFGRLHELILAINHIG